MAKGKANLNSSEDLVPPQPRSLRSRKRDRPDDEAPLTDDVQTPVTQQCPQSPLQECAVVINQQAQAAEQSSTKEKDAEAPKEATDAVVTGKEETTVTNNDSQLDSFGVLPHNDITGRGKDKEGIASEECNRSPHPACTDLLPSFQPISEKGEGSCAKENSQHTLERNQSRREEPSSMCMDDVKEVAQQAGGGFPVKKKRRMGTCGLTETEQSHFLLIQQHENGKSPSSPLSNPADRVIVQSEAEPKLQAGHRGPDDSIKAEVHVAASTSDGIGTVCDPGRLEGKRRDAEGDGVQTGEPESNQLAEEEEEVRLQELRGPTAEIMAEIPEKQQSKGEAGSAEADRSSDIKSVNDESNTRQTVETAPLQVKSENGTGDDKEGDTPGVAVGGGGADAGASGRDSQSGGTKCGSVELCEAALTPGGSERKRRKRCDADGAPAAGPSPGDAEHAQSGDAADTFGPGCFDYVSDSQLNTVVLIEEEVMEKEGELGSLDCHADATDLICGLIRELSSLNRKVMATHRELENLRRSSRSSRSSLR